MALTFGTLSGSYLWPVKIPVPMDGGEIETLEFKGRFKRFNQKETEAILKRAMSAHRAMVTGSELMEVLLSYGGAARAIVEAWNESLNGKKAKN